VADELDCSLWRHKCIYAGGASVPFSQQWCTNAEGQKNNHNLDRIVSARGSQVLRQDYVYEVLRIHAIFEVAQHFRKGSFYNSADSMRMRPRVSIKYLVGQIP
jgi:hypothetical protein